VGAAAGLYVYVRYARFQTQTPSDFDPIWVGARALVTGGDPYAAVAAQGKTLVYPLFYPLMGVILAAPLALLPPALARVIWVGAAAGLLAYAVSARGWWRLTILATGSFLFAVQTAQWAPWIVLGAVVPALGFWLTAKPSIGLALFAAYARRTTVISCAALVLLSFLVRPGWPAEWLHAIRGDDGHIVSLVARPFGFVLLLALARWRDPDARLVAGLALVPQTLMVYDALPLMLVARNFREAGTLAVLNLAAGFYVDHEIRTPGYTVAAFSAHIWPVVLVLVYLPALALVLARIRTDRRGVDVS